MKNVYIKNRIRHRGEIQFFMHQFVEAAIAEGVKPVADFPAFKGKRTLASFAHRIIGPYAHSNRCLIVTSQGGWCFRKLFSLLWCL